tara:strand:+ start:331 stop:501 length:171 start_codon:yes stop_codon:yes gene_type:complete
MSDIKQLKMWREQALDTAPPPSLDKSMRRRWYELQQRKIENFTRQIKQMEDKNAKS